MISKYKKLILTLILILLISSLGIFVLGVGEAKAQLGIVDGLKTILGGFLLTVQEICGGLVAFLAGLAQGILGFTNLQNAQMVQDGWKIVRDLVNMFFVLVLLAIAFATILRFETYGMKALLPKLIIAALLINFSLVLAGVFIDFAGVLTNFFIEDSTDFFENIADEMGLTSIETTTAQDSGSYWACSIAGKTDNRYPTEAACDAGCTFLSIGWPWVCSEVTPPKVDWGNIQGDRFWKVIGALFLSIAFTVIAALVFGALAVLLLVRVIIIWFLLILSPIAWFFWILPATRHLFTQWWNTFIKWVFFAPAAIFFIWLSVNSWLKFIQGKAPDAGGEIVTGMKEVITDDIIQGIVMPNVMRPENLVQFLIACGMLIGALVVAQKMGIAGANIALGAAKWFGKGAAGGVNRWLAGGGKMAGAGALTKGLRKIGWEKGARGLEAFGRAKQKAVPYVSPGVWKRGWVARREEAEREAFRLSAPALQDKLTGAFSLGKEKSDYLEKAKRRERIEERNKIDTTNSEELTGGFKKASEAGLGSKAAAYAQASAEQGDLNDLMRELGYDFNAEGISEFTEKQLVPLVGEQDAYRLGHDLNKSVEKVGQWPGRVFKAEYDDKTGKTTYSNLIKTNTEEALKAGKTKEEGIEKGTKEALGEANKPWSRLEPQERARFTHRLGIISESKDVPPKDLGIKGHEAWIGGLPSEHAKRIPDEVISTLMFRHSDETKKLNPELHKELGEILTDRSPEQREEMKRMVKEVAKEDKYGNEIPTSSWSPGETEASSTEASSTVTPTKESFEEARAKSPPGAFG